MEQTRLEQIKKTQQHLIRYINTHMTSFISEDLKLMKEAVLAIHDLLEKSDV